MGRILELKNEMVQLESLEYHYFDDILVDMKLTPVGRVGGALREGLGRQVMCECTVHLFGLFLHACTPNRFICTMVSGGIGTGNIV